MITVGGLDLETTALEQCAGHQSLVEFSRKLIRLPHCAYDQTGTASSRCRSNTSGRRLFCIPTIERHQVRYHSRLRECDKLCNYL